MTGTKYTATARRRGLSPFLALFAASLVATWMWLKFDGGPQVPAISAMQRARQTPAAALKPSTSMLVPAVHREPDLQQGEPDSGTAVAEPLPADQLAALIDAGIGADDSEQRSLAILELSRAPVEQSLPGLGRILRENRDRRSRMTALEALLRLPDSPLVREQRHRLLDMLSRDPDTDMAEAVRAASAAAS